MVGLIRLQLCTRQSSSICCSEETHQIAEGDAAAPGQLRVAAGSSSDFAGVPKCQLPEQVERGLLRAVEACNSSTIFVMDVLRTINWEC